MSSPRLFSKADIHAVLENQKDLFNQALQKLPAETALQMCKEFGDGSEPTLRAFVDEHWLHVPIIDDSKIECVEDEEAQVDGRGNPNRIIHDYDRPFYVPGRRVTLAAPFEGDAEFFDIRPNSYTSAFPGAEIEGKEVRVTYQRESPVDYAAIQRDFIRTLGEINQYLRSLSESVFHFNGQLTEIGRRYALERKTRLDKDAAGMEKLGIPIRKKEADATTPAMRDKVFFSYSHKDRKWLEKFQKMLKPLVRNEKIVVWNDTQIIAGDRWKEEIQKALASAKVAVLLVSPNFLDSDFIAEHELPPLLNAAKEAGLTILWVSVSHCLYTETEIAEYQAANNPAHPLDSLSTSEQNRVIAEICKQIEAAANRQSPARQIKHDLAMKNLISEEGQENRPMKSDSDKYVLADRGSVAYGNNASNNTAITGSVGRDVVVNVHNTPSPPDTVRDYKARIEYDAALRLKRAVFGVRDAISSVRNLGSSADFQSKLNTIAESMSALYAELREAEAHWGEAALQTSKELERCVWKLRQGFERHIAYTRQKKDPSHSIWEEIDNIIWENDPVSDPFTLEIISAVKQILSFLDPYLNPLRG